MSNVGNPVSVSIAPDARDSLNQMKRVLASVLGKGVDQSDTIRIVEQVLKLTDDRAIERAARRLGIVE